MPQKWLYQLPRLTHSHRFMYHVPQAKRMMKQTYRENGTWNRTNGGYLGILIRDTANPEAPSFPDLVKWKEYKLNNAKLRKEKSHWMSLQRGFEEDEAMERWNGTMSELRLHTFPFRIHQNVLCKCNVELVSQAFDSSLTNEMKCVCVLVKYSHS